MGWLLAMVLAAGTPAFGYEEVRVVETHELPVPREGAGPGASHRLRLSLHVFRGARWSQEEVAAAVLESAGLLRQCGVALSGAELRVEQEPRRFHV